MYYPTTLHLLSFNLKFSIVFYMVARLFWWYFYRPKRAHFQALVTALPAEMQLHILQYLNRKDRNNFGVAFPWWRRLVNAYRDRLPEYTREDLEKQQRDELKRRAFIRRLTIRLHALYTFAHREFDDLEPFLAIAALLAASRFINLFGLGAMLLLFLVTGGGGPLLSDTTIWLITLPLTNTSYGAAHWWFEFAISGTMSIYFPFVVLLYSLLWYCQSLLGSTAAFDRDLLIGSLLAIGPMLLFASLFFFHLIHPSYTVSIFVGCVLGHFLGHFLRFCWDRMMAS